MADGEDEVDYMSDNFLAQCVGNNDVRPGLLYSHKSKREAEVEKKRKIRNDDHRKRFKPAQVVQQERRKEGLNTALDSSNKGFAMLQKMGYKPGSSLGKQGDGRVEPVAVELKADRVGLGWQQMIADHRKKQQDYKKKSHKEAIDPEKYRARMRNQRQEKQIKSDLMKSQRICHQMDSKADITEPEETWFWPSYALKQEDEEEDEDEDEVEEEEELEFEPGDQLNFLTAYLKATYNYCIWCGTVYEDEQDFQQNCPGQTRADHDD